MKRKKQIYTQLAFNNKGRNEDKPKIPIPFLVLQNKHSGKLREVKETEESQSLKLTWVKNAADSGDFDLDFLIKYNKILENF